MSDQFPIPEGLPSDAITPSAYSVSETFNDFLQEDPEDIQQVLNVLLELDGLEQPDSFNMGDESIASALQHNEIMQQKVQSMIDSIDKRLEVNTNYMKEAIHLSLVENRFSMQPSRKLIIHRRYDQEIDYFGKENLLMENKKVKPTEEGASDEEEEDSEEEEEEEEEVQADNEHTLQIKAWSKAERERLSSGIHSEAKRMLSYDFVKKNEAWRIWEVDKMPTAELERFPVERIDWKRISNLHVHSRTPTECLIQWTTQEHPTINKKPWSKKESERLSELVEQIGLFSGKWELIASSLGTNRTIAQCFSHYMSGKNNESARSLTWSSEENRRLKEAVKRFGNCNWQQVASIMTGRTGQQCLHRWSKSLNPAIRRKKWDDDEDRLLRRAVDLYGAGNWRKVQRLVPGRTDMQCRERWVNILQPSVIRTEMTPDEMRKLFGLVAQYGPKWSYIATLMPGRTDNVLMRSYNRALKIQNRETRRTEDSEEIEKDRIRLEKENERKEKALRKLERMKARQDKALAKLEKIKAKQEQIKLRREKAILEKEQPKEGKKRGRKRKNPEESNE